MSAAVAKGGAPALLGTSPEKAAIPLAGKAAAERPPSDIPRDESGRFASKVSSVDELATLLATPDPAKEEGKAEEGAEEPNPELEQEAGAADAEEDAEPESDAPESMSIAELAQQLEVDEASLLAQVTIEGADGKPIPLSAAIDGFRANPRAAQHEAALARASTEFTTARATHANAYQARLVELDTMLHATASLLASDEESVNWADLRQQDPASYVEQRERFDARKREFSDLYRRAEATVKQAKQKSDAELNEWRNAERSLLASMFPEVASPETGRQWYKERVAALVAAGFSEQELNPEAIPLLDDHRVWVLIDKAAKFDKIQSETKAKLQPLKKLPKVALRSASRRAELSAEERGRQDFQAKLARLSKSGDVRDLAALLGAKE